MDLSQLRYFDAVARHGSFSAAARVAGVLLRSSAGLTPATRALVEAIEGFARRIGTN